MTLKTTINLPTDYQNFIALSRYARWIPEESRREEWSETINRYLDYITKHLKKMHNFCRLLLPIPQNFDTLYI